MDDFDTMIQSDELVPEEYEDEGAAPKMFYEIPTQVKVRDFAMEEPHYFGGIAYRDEVICGCCGGILSIAELYEDAKEAGAEETDVIIPYENWADISEGIKGDD